MKQYKVIRDPEAFQLLGDKTRRQIVFLLRAKEMSASQIADALDKTPQAIYHHIKKLREADIVEVAREERVGHFIETYYQATAEVFSCSYGESGGEEFVEQEFRGALEVLQKAGLEIHLDDQTVSKLVKLKQSKGHGGDRELETRVTELEDVDFNAQQTATHFANLISMGDKDFEQYLEREKEFRDLLRSMIMVKVAA